MCVRAFICFSAHVGIGCCWIKYHVQKQFLESESELGNIGRHESLPIRIERGGDFIDCSNKKLRFCILSSKHARSRSLKAQSTAQEECEPKAHRSWQVHVGEPLSLSTCILRFEALADEQALIRVAIRIPFLELGFSV